MYTKRQKEIIEFLENLVGKRHDIDSLTKILSKEFEENILCEIVNDDDEENSLTDWNIMFNSLSEETYGYFDIYILKQRQVGHDGTTFYITEVGYEFN